MSANEKTIALENRPKALALGNLILELLTSVLGTIIGMELIVRSGVTPNTSIM